MNPSRPMNVGEIVEKAQSFDYNALIPLRYWFRTAGTILKEVYCPTCYFKRLLTLDH